MKGFRFGLLVILAGVFFVAADISVAQDYTGLWVGTASLNHVGRVNKKIPDLTFNLGLSGVNAEQTNKLIAWNAEQTNKLIAWNSDNWVYHDPQQTPLTWNGPAYDDSEWSSGSAPFFYGSPPEVINPEEAYTELTSGGNGTLSAWGSNASEQLGLGYGIGLQKAPGPIVTEFPERAWNSVAAGANHTVAIRGDGTLWAWGDNSKGQLGDDSKKDKTSPTQIGTDTDWVSVAAGYGHTLAIDVDGKLWAWGDNSKGQLGDDSKKDKTSPTQIGTDTDWVSVAAGYGHTLAIDVDGKLWAWGDNSKGQLGDDSKKDKTSPTQIGKDTDWVSVAAGYYHTVALKSQGELWTWGANGYGQLGDGTTDDKQNPTRIGKDTHWDSVAAGSYYTVAIRSEKTEEDQTESNTLWAWGYNKHGQLGDDSTSAKTIPTRIGKDTHWDSVAAGSHTVALKSNGTLWAWGNNSHGQLGDGTSGPNQNKLIPTRIGKDTDWDLVAAGDYSTVALKSNKTLWVWGNNSRGQLGDNRTLDRNMPSQIDKWVMVAGGRYHALAIMSDGTLWTWGANDYGQLGLGTAPTYLISPRQVASDIGWQSVAAGEYHTVAIKSDGTLWTWGDNSRGQLGDGSTNDKTIPTQIGKDTDWVSVAAGSYHTVAIKSDGTLWTWGANAYGQLGNGTRDDQTSPKKIDSETTWVSVAAGDYHTIAIDAQKTLWAWGDNHSGQLAQNPDNYNSKTSPVRVDSSPKVMWLSVAAGGSHTVAIQKNNTLWAWGSNDFGQMGTGTSAPNAYTYELTQIAGTTWEFVAAGHSHTMAVKQDGTLWAWGTNEYGQLGLGDQAPVYVAAPTRITPPPLPGTNWACVAAGSYNTVAIDDQGRLWAWGANECGQLGMGSAAPTFSPPVVTPTMISPDQWMSIATGRSHTVAIRSDNTLWTWGSNDQGQLGMGPAAAKHIVSPKQIVTTDPSNDSPWVRVAAGANHTVAIREDAATNEHTLWAWGANRYGQLGDNSTTDGHLPKQIVTTTDLSNNSPWIWVAAGANHTMAIKKDGTLWAWGANRYGQLGDNSTTDSHLPTKIGPDTDWVSVAAGAFHTVGIRSDGTLWAWGDNSHGQLGDASTDNKHSPKQIGTDTDTDWVSVVAGAFHTVGIQEDATTDERTLWAWGWNNYGQLGDGTSGPDQDKLIPTKIGLDTDWFSAAAGSAHTVAIRSQETEENQTGRFYTLWAWGANDSGQLGDGSIQDKNTPAQIGSGTTWACVAAGTWHTVAIQSMKATVYFRHEFTVDTKNYTSLKLEILRDDGAVVYLNGTEIMRTNMPSGTILHTTPPLNAVGSADEGQVIVQEIDLRQMPVDLLKADNVLAVEVHQHPAEVIDAADDVPAMTRTAAPLDLRLLLHQDSNSTVRLLKEVITMNMYDNKTGELRRALFTDHTQIAKFRLPAEPEGVRVSAVGFDFEGPYKACEGAISTSGTVNCQFVLPKDHPTNPFLHKYHPDHDNLDPRYENSAEEAYPITRNITIEFENRYPPDKYERMRTPSPEWGHTMLGGTYKETITGLHREGGIEVSGPFILQRVSERDKLNE